MRRMKERLLSLVLAIAMVVTLMPVMTQKASAAESTTDVEDLSIPGWFSATSQGFEILDGDVYKLTFHNKSTGAENINNFLLLLSTSKDSGAGRPSEIALIRPDRFLSGKDGYAELGDDWDYYFYDNIDWNNFVSTMKSGVDVTVVLRRMGDTFIYDITMGPYQQKASATSTVELPAVCYFFLSGSAVELTNVKVTRYVGEVGAIPETVDGSGKDYAAGKSNAYQITKEGIRLECISVMDSDATENYNTANFEIWRGYYDNEGNEGYLKEFLFAGRSDGAGRADEGGIVKWSPNENGYTFKADFGGVNWDEWRAANKAGMPVTVDAKLVGTSVVATITNGVIKSNIKVPLKNATDPVYIFLATDHCTLKDVVAKSLAPKVTGHSLTLAGDIGVNFYVNPGSLTDLTGTYTVGGETKSVDGVAQEDGTVIKFSCPVNSTQMDEKVTLTIKDSTGAAVLTDSYAASEYTYTGTENAEKVNALVNKMKVYGAYAKAYFGKSDVAAGTAAPTDVAADKLAGKAVKVEGTNDGAVKFYGASLVLDTTTTINYYFAGSEADVKACTFKVGEKTLTPVAAGDGFYRVSLEGIYAQDLDTDYKLTVTGAKTSVTSVTYSGYSYVYYQLTSGTDAKLTSVVKALYDYCEAANAYLVK